jgi:hypothetical protein
LERTGLDPGGAGGRWEVGEQAGIWSLEASDQLEDVMSRKHEGIKLVF